MRRKAEIDLEAFAADVAAGMSANALMLKYRIGYARAAALKAELGGGAPAPHAAEPEPTGAAPASQARYDLSLSIPAERLDYLIGSFALDDALAALLSLDDDGKAWAVEFVVQRRLSRLIDPPPASELRSIADALDRLSRPLTGAQPTPGAQPETPAQPASAAQETCNGQA
jgi:hypothetical protein